jgi:hypothetical protein
MIVFDTAQHIINIQLFRVYIILINIHYSFSLVILCFHNPENDSLGGWTDELSGDHITKYMSGGPKKYAYETRGGKSLCKVKGLTLNLKNTVFFSYLN